MVKTTFKDWVQLGRPHTAALTTAIVIIGWLVAGGALLSWTTLFLFIIGLLFHYSGFVHNNICDFKDDLNDPAKSHWAMNRGAISMNRAYAAWLGSAIAMFALAAWVTHWNIWAMLVLVLAFIFGAFYNLACKKTVIAPVLISVSFMLLPLFGFLVVSQNLTLVLWLVLAYAFSQMMFQIAVEGYLKDIDSDRVNGLRRLGAGTYIVNGERTLVSSTSANVFSFCLKFMTVYIGTLILVLFNEDFLPVFVCFIFTTLSIATGLKLLEFGKFDRRVIWCSATEILVYFALVWALLGPIGLPAALLLTLYPILWFVVMNKYLWGTVLAPKV